MPPDDTENNVSSGADGADNVEAEGSQGQRASVDSETSDLTDDSGSAPVVEAGARAKVPTAKSAPNTAALNTRKESASSQSKRSSRLQAPVSKKTATNLEKASENADPQNIQGITQSRR